MTEPTADVQLDPAVQALQEAEKKLAEFKAQFASLDTTNDKAVLDLVVKMETEVDRLNSISEELEDEAIALRLAVMAEEISQMVTELYGE